MEIKSIEPKSNYYEINLSNEKYLIKYEQLENLELYVGKIVEFEDYKKIIDSSRFNEIEIKARNYCLKRIVSNVKVSDYLKKFDLKCEEKKIIIYNLNELGLINDELYIENLISSKKLSNSFSRQKLFSFLKFEGYPLELINEKMKDYTEDEEFEKMENIFSRKYKNLDTSDLKLKSKVMNYFLSNLYPLEKVRKLLEED
ncbi:RecX family transcriptional regulator [Citroniella saccharovorans]|uniref:RecX family transcriptional regulator n=1 Tax=Citroniella saccharovorans TaxID=2053367 RepID=A0AAW9MTR2_9FIRM|nr:RecX family transcriptional regulator [Citroniella saccharovorans]MEB3429551.1 RecX family transcriptional regulator [Citroniella saccharovorans]